VTPPIENKTLLRTVEVRGRHASNIAAAAELGVSDWTVGHHIRMAASRGLLGTKPVLPGFRLSKTTAVRDAYGKLQKEYIQQKAGEAEPYIMPEGFALKRDSAYLDGEGRRVGGWMISEPSYEAALVAMRAAAAGFRDELPRASPVATPSNTEAELLNLYAVTDAHFGMLSWREETGADYDLDIAEKLLLDWFAAAIDLAPAADTAIFAQIGDLLHYDGFESKTPTSGHILDADSRLPKVIRVVIRTLRRVVGMLLKKHSHVHIIMADANHDPASEAWLREMFAAFYDDEPRVTVDSSSSTYYGYQHGDVSLFVHHGHKRKVGNVDSVFAGKFREMYGKTKFSYAHLGHLHSDELRSTNLMKVERHETLAAPDAYASNGGWISGRSAKVITYSKRHGEVARLTLSPGMVGGWHATNDNTI
jgi:hypothetical protein